MIERLRFPFVSIDDLKRKMAAWRELFSSEPGILLCGTWQDSNGDEVFFDMAPSWQVITIGRVALTVCVDGANTRLTPMTKCEFIMIKR